MTKARDLANAADVLDDVSATELGYVNGVTSAIQTQIDSKEPTLPSQTGNSGKYLTTNGSTKSWGTVNQPLTWTQRTTFSNSDAMTSVAYNGSNLYVAVGTGGKMATSTNGITWTARTSGFGTQTIQKVVFGNGLFVAVGSNGIITTSTDGITWTARTANMGTNVIYDVIYANSLWVAVGDGGGTTNTGGITYSTDGLTWTRKSQSITVGTTYNAVVWNGTNWIIGAQHSTNNYLYASTPSGTWTAGADGTAKTYQNIFWDGTRHINVYSDGAVYFSTSATMGTVTQFGGTYLASTSYRNSYYNSKIFTAGSFMQSYETTPDANNMSVVNYLGFASTRMNGGGTISATTYSLWVGATGYILGDDQGRIFTSF